MAKKKKTPKPSELVLRKLFNKRVNSLAETIVSLIPPPSPKCYCNKRRCFGCIAPDKFMSFLVRHTDSPEYKKLLKECFVVVSDTATKHSSFDFSSRWNQSQIVRGTIKRILEKQKRSANLICVGYDKNTGNSAIVELLTSSAWGVLLKRIGDSLMVYLLENTLIFLPHARSDHIQVSGLSIKNSCFQALNRESNMDQDRSVNNLGCENNLKRSNQVHNKSTEQQASSPLESSSMLHSSTCIGCSQKQYIAQFNGQKSKVLLQSSSKNNIVSNGTVGSAVKHSHKWSWQRQRNSNSVRLSLDPCREGVLSKFQALQPCKCCSAFQNLPNVNEQAQIYRWIMLYNMKICSSAFPQKHTLNSLLPKVEGANALLKEIFGDCWTVMESVAEMNKEIEMPACSSMPCYHRCNICQIKSKCLYHSLSKLLRTLISNVKRRQISHFLDKHCAVPSFEKDPDGSAYISKGSSSEGNHACKKRKIKLEEKVIVENKFAGDCDSDAQSSSQPIPNNAQHGLANLYSSHSQVMAFTWAVCRSIVPPDLLGNPSNQRILRRNIYRFIRLRRFENFSLKQCMHELKMSDFPLLCDKHSSCNLSAIVGRHSGGCDATRSNSGGSVECDNVDGTYFVKHKLFKCWIYWLFSCFVVPLLQANFYITESENGKQELFYYRKSVWKEVISETVECLKTPNFHLVDKESLQEILRNRSFGYSRARLCPKGSGVRVLANLKACSTNKNQKFKSVNSVLQSIHVILKGIQVKHHDKLGSSVFDYNDVYKKFFRFISLLRNGGTTIPKVFIVVADVSKAFDTVNQNKMLEVIKALLLDDEYKLSKSDKIVPTKKSFYVKQLLSSTPHAHHSQPGILVNQGLSVTIKKEKIVSDLFEHIERNILKLDGMFYWQSIGIPQGSVVSSLLCSFYYGHMENNVINPYLGHSHALEDSNRLRSSNTSTSGGSSTEDVDNCNPEYMLMRLIDDYFFVSTSKQQAMKFFSLLQKGFCDYNAIMNESKFGSNFHVNHKSNQEANRTFVGKDGVLFLKWSGLLINSSTLEIQADYSRYLESHLSSTLTLSWKDRPYQKLREKLCDYLRPKCHPIFYDASINSARVVRLNMYQVFLLGAMKFHSYVSALFNLGTLYIKSIIGTLLFSFRYLHKMIKRRNYYVFRATSLRPSFKMVNTEIEWLGIFAYIRVLKRKQSRYGSLVSILESKLKSLPIDGNLRPALNYATDDKHSSVFWEIQY